jgi:hypothetical protein
LPLFYFYILAIFKEEMEKLLDEGEMIEGDFAYRGPHCCSRDDYLTEEERIEKSELRARQEIVNRRLKQRGILKQQFRNNRHKHHSVFYAIAVMT